MGVTGQPGEVEGTFGCGCNWGSTTRCRRSAEVSPSLWHVRRQVGSHVYAVVVQGGLQKASAEPEVVARAEAGQGKAGFCAQVQSQDTYAG